MAFSDIITVAASRLSVIKVTSGYNTDIGKKVKLGADAMPLDDLPYCAAHIPSRSPAETSRGGARQTVDAQLIIEAAAKYTGNSFDTAKLLLADIQKAMEIEPENFGGLLINDGLQWQGDEIIFPAGSSNVVGVTVTYSIPHLRFFGDPTKPEVN